MKIRLLLIACLCALGTFSTAQVFDFEDEAVSTTVRAFSMTEGGITASFLDPGADSTIIDWNPNPGVPASWGDRHFLPALHAANHQFINFSTPLAFLSVEFGDYFGEDDEVHLRAWSGLGGTGAILDSDDVFYDASLGLPDDVGFASVSHADGFLSLELWEDGFSGRNDVAFDNMTVRPVPEPATMIALGVGIAALAARRRRKSAA